MKNRILILVILSFMLNTSKAQNKIGYINVDKIFAVLPETAKADSTLAAYQESLAKKLDGQNKDLEVAYAKFIKDSSTMTSQVKAAARKKLNDALADYNNNQQEFDNMLKQEQEKMVQPIREKIITAIQAYAKQNGYAHILYESNALVLNAEDNITQKIIDKLKGN